MRMLLGNETASFCRFIAQRHLSKGHTVYWADPDQTYRWANILASDLHTLNEVSGVELFGSVARGTPTRRSDIDVIVLTEDHDLATRWLKACFGNSREVRYDRAMKRTRLEYAATVLGCPWLRDWDGIDIFILPHNWGENVTKLAREGSYFNLEFLTAIAYDATRFDPLLNRFPVAEERRRGVVRMQEFDHWLQRQLSD